MSSQAQSQQNIERDRRRYTFWPLPQHDAQNLESNLSSNGSEYDDDCLKCLETSLAVTGLALIVLIIYLTSYLMLIKGVLPPHATIDSESFIAKFNVSDSQLKAAIDFDITFGCKDCDYYETDFDRTNGTIFYIGIAVSTVSDEPFGLGKNELKTLKLKLATFQRGCQIPMMELPNLQEMEHDLKNGTIPLSLKIHNQVHLDKWGIPLYDVAYSVDYNWDLTLKFSPTCGVGRLIQIAKKPC